jgi:hypothetical protein
MTKGVSRSAKRCEAFCAAAMTLMWGRVMALSPENACGACLDQGL